MPHDRLIDMLQAARDGRDFVEGLTRKDFDDDRKTQFAVARALEVLGEAAAHVDDETREEHADLPWRQMIGMRSVITHEYFRIDPDIVWDVVSTQLVPLIDRLEQIVPSEEP